MTSLILKIKINSSYDSDTEVQLARVTLISYTAWKPFSYSHWSDFQKEAVGIAIAVSSWN